MNFVITPECEMDIFDLTMHARLKTRSEARPWEVHLVAEVMRERAKRDTISSAGSGAFP